jgi:hypothetical protein
MLREILEGASWGEDGELVFSEIMQLVQKINSKIGSADIDSRTYQSLAKAKDELKKALRRM